MTMQRDNHAMTRIVIPGDAGTDRGRLGIHRRSDIAAARWIPALRFAPAGTTSERAQEILKWLS